MEKHFGIGAVVRRDSKGPELCGQRPVPVNLPVEHQGVARCLVDTRLRAAGGIDYRQARVTHRDVVVDEDTIAVGSAMTQRGVHLSKDAAGIGSRVGEPGDAAHYTTTCWPIL